MLVSAGGTREPLDAVRFLGNRSSGRMGVALAEEARRRGAYVTLLAANLAVAVPHGIEPIQTPDGRGHARRGARTLDADVVVIAAAVADYRPAEPIDGKRAKDGAGLELELEPTVDILRELGERTRNGQVLVAFAADTARTGSRANARSSRRRTPT